MSGVILGLPIQFFVDADGRPYANGTLTFDEPGLDTPIVVYGDVDLTIELDNPLELNAAGRAPAMYTGAYAVDVTLKDSDGVVIWGPITVPASSQASANLGQGPALFGDPTSGITAVAYPAGTSYSAAHPGTLILEIDSSDLPGTYGLQAMLMGDGSNTMTLGIFNISDGSPNVALVEVASNSATGEVKISAAISFPAGGASKFYMVKSKVTSGTGFGWAISLTRLS